MDKTLIFCMVKKFTTKMLPGILMESSVEETSEVTKRNS